MIHTLLKNSFFATLLVLFCAFFQSCDPFGEKATGEYITETFDATDFHGIELNVSADVTLRVDSVYRIEVTCEETAMPYLQVLETGGILKIYFDRDVYDVDNMKIEISAPSWDDFEVNGSGKVRVVDPISGNVLRADISGSGDLEIEDAEFQTARLDVSGSGNISLSGQGESLYGDVSGSGDIDALHFPVEYARLDVSGSGTIRTDVSEHLDATVSGSGDIYYKGNPQLNLQVSGSGKVRKL